MFNFSSDQTRLNAFQTHAVDFAFAALSNSSAATSAAAAVGGQDVAVPIYSTYSLVVNFKAPLNSDAVRHALSLGIDRAAISKSLFFGQCAATVQPFAPGLPGYVASDDQISMYDPAKAKQLLASAGATALSLTMVVPNFDPLPKIAQVVQGEWAQIGVTVHLDLEAAGAAVAKFQGGGGNVSTLPINSGPTPSAALTDYEGNLSVAGQTSIPALKSLVTRASSAAALVQGSDAARSAYQDITNALVAAPLSIMICRTSKVLVGQRNLIGLGPQLPYVSFDAGSFDPTALAIGSS